MGLYVFHQGAWQNNQLWFTAFPSSTGWQVDQQVPNVGIVASPGTAVFQDKLYVFHQATVNSGQLRYSIFDGNTWSDEFLVPPSNPSLMAGSPSAVAFNEKLYVFHTYGSKELHKGFIEYDWFDGTTWKGSGAPAGPNEEGMTGSPAAVVYNSSIYLFYQGWGDHIGELWFTASSDGRNWSDPNRVPTVGMSESPAAVVYNSVLYVLHQGAWQSGELWFTAFPSSTGWQVDQQVPNVGMSASPGVVVYNSLLYAFHQGAQQNGQLWFTAFDGMNWLGDQPIADIGMSASPSACVFPAPSV